MSAAFAWSLLVLREDVPQCRFYVGVAEAEIERHQSPRDRPLAGDHDLGHLPVQELKSEPGNRQHGGSPKGVAQGV